MGFPGAERPSDGTPSGATGQPVTPLPMAHVGNMLIDQLPKADRVQLLDRCEPFEMCLSAELSVRGQTLSHAHFHACTLGIV